jgi:hypothetical protein
VAEASGPFITVATSISNIYKVVDSSYKVMSLTYQICFIYLPIPVMGPEGPSMSLVLSWELAFYEISVASQKSLILVFLEWFTIFLFYCLFSTVLLRTFIGFKSGIMTCRLASSGDMMNFLVESG